MIGEWTTGRLGDCVRLQSGGTPSKSRTDFWTGDIPWVSAKDMKSYWIEDSEDHLSEAGVNAAARIVERGTTLLLVRGMTLHKDVPISRIRRPAAFNQDVKAALACSGTDPEFVPYLLLGNKAKILSIVDSAGHGTGRLNSDTLLNLPVRTPPIEEQRAIAHILGTLDDKIELNRRMNETLEAMARAIFKSWFLDFDPVRAKAESRDPGLPAHIADLFPDSFEDSELGAIPGGWKVDTLGNLSQKPQYGYTASANSEPVGPKFLRIADINKQAWIDWATVPFCEISAEDYEKYKTLVGDILIARMADPGHGVMVEEEVDAVLASYLIRFKLRDAEYSRYMQYWLRSEAYWELVTSRSAGTTRANLNAKVLSAFPLIVPSRAVASAFRRVSDSMRAKVVTNVDESRALAAIRDALLPKLLSGEVRVREAAEIVEDVV